MQRVVPNLWFDNEAEEAVQLYVSTIPNSKIFEVTRYGESGSDVSGKPAGSVMMIQFELDGQQFTALNGGPQYSFSPAISLLINCDTQEEVDTIWEALSADKAAEQCGWLKDRYGLSWQVVPRELEKLMSDPDPEKVERVFTAMLQMKKLDINKLRAASAG